MTRLTSTSSLCSTRQNTFKRNSREYTTSTHDPFSQADREKFLIGMMKVNFLKRLESSVKSFEITMERTIAKIEGARRKDSTHYLKSLPKGLRRKT